MSRLTQTSTHRLRRLSINVVDDLALQLLNASIIAYQRYRTTLSKAHLQHATWPVILFRDDKVFKKREPLALVISKEEKVLSVIPKQLSTQVRLGLPDQLSIIAPPTIKAYAVQTHTMDLVLSKSNKCRRSTFPLLPSVAIRY